MITCSGAEYLTKALEAEGITVVFGQSGHTVLPVLDALVDSSIAFIPTPHEQHAVHAADLFFRVSGRPAAVLTTIAPGLANTIVGLLDAVADCSGVLLIAGNAPSTQRGREAFQELTLHGDDGQVDILRAVTKRSWHVSSAGDLPFALDRAFNVMLTGRPGPVAIDVALDVFSWTGDFPEPRTSEHRPHGEPRADPDLTGAALDLLASAEHPVIVAGGGATSAATSTELTRLAEYLAVPVITSMIGHSAIASDHVLAGGFTGAVGTPTAHDLATSADVAFAIGTRFSEMDANSWQSSHFLDVPNRCRLIHLDIDPHEIGRIYPTEIALVGDAHSVLREMNELATAKFEPADLASHPRVRDLAVAKLKWAEAKKQISVIPDHGPFEPAALVAALRQVMPDNGILVSGTGIRHAVCQHFPVRAPKTHFVASGNGTMGLSAPGAIGAALAAPDTPVVALVGDGELRSVASCLLIAAEQALPILFVVVNNGEMASISLYQNRHFGRLSGTRFERSGDATELRTDFVKLANAFGLDAIRVESGADLIPTLEHGLSSGKPYLVDAPVTERGRVLASGDWIANRYIKPGWNVAEALKVS